MHKQIVPGYGNGIGRRRLAARPNEHHIKDRAATSHRDRCVISGYEIAMDCRVNGETGLDHGLEILAPSEWRLPIVL
ncbi:MAG: hypothetical protein HKM95_17570, partial [Inquilinus sp.]|nr:hypothetical protein [Inquilinus sp.]